MAAVDLHDRPRSTVTARLQQSGQSSGHAVFTVEWPHDRSGGAAEESAMR